MHISSDRLRPEAYGNVAVTPWHLIERLYDQKINAGLQADCGRGIVTVWIGGPRDACGGGVKVERTFERDEFDLIAPWLEAEAERLLSA